MNPVAKLASLILGLFGLGQAGAATPLDKARDEPVFMAMPDAALADAAKAAKALLPDFIKLISKVEPSDGSPMVKTYIEDPDGGGIWLWLAVDEVTPSGFEARVFEAPPQFTDLVPGTRRFVPNEAVGDWAMVVSGVMHGGYSLRLQRNRLPESERATYDGYIGAESYAPLPIP